MVNNSSDSKYYVQTANIDLSAYYWSSIGTYTVSSYGSVTEKYFAGHYDGGGFTISGLYTSSSGGYHGFFGNVHGATIENVNIGADSVIRGSDSYVGAIVAYAINYT